MMSMKRHTHEASWGRRHPSWARIAAAVMALLLGVLVWSNIAADADEGLLEKYGVTLLGIEVALAVFSINLSLVIFQLSPYRHLVPGMSARHLALAAGVLALSLAPLALSGSDAS